MSEAARNSCALRLRTKKLLKGLYTFSISKAPANHKWTAS